MPVFALFFPLPAAVGMTAVVHLLNNLFKLALTGHHAHPKTVLRFGIPAILAAFVGAWALQSIGNTHAFYAYSLGNHVFEMTPLKLIMALLIFGFALIEILPQFRNLSFEPKHMLWGGILSGFFGGFSGQQGALRNAFLIRASLSKEALIGTSVMIACFVDLTRLMVYTSKYFSSQAWSRVDLVFAAATSAFLGAWIANRLLPKVTLGLIQKLMAGLMITISAALAAGLI